MTRLKLFTIVVVLLLTTSFFLAFQPQHDFHAYGVYFSYIVLVLTSLWARKLVPVVAGYLVIVHIAIDAYYLRAIPFDALYESIFIVALALVLYYITRSQAKVKKELEHSHQLLNYIIQHNNAAVAVHDRDLKYIYVSDQYLKQYRVTEKNVIGKHHYDVFPDLPKKWRKVHQRVLKGEVLREDRDPYPRENGSVDYTRWECRPWFKNDGEIGGIIVYTEVINDQIRIEKALEDSRDELLLLMDHLPIGVGIHQLEPTPRFQYLNENFSEILETDDATLMERDFLEMIFQDENERARVREQLRDLMKTSETTSLHWLDVPIKRPNSMKHVSLYTIKMHGENRLITTLIDVTTQKLREEDIIKMSNEDVVTGIPNRKYFSERFNALDHTMNYPLVMLLIDVDGLKLINDAFGFDVGTKVLKNVAKAVQHVARKRDVYARVGSDEFALLMTKSTPEEIENVKQRIHERIQSIAIDNMEFTITIGSAAKTSRDTLFSELYRAAEEDMYRKKVLEKRSSRSNTIQAILATLTDKFHVEKVHSERVGDIAQRIGEALALDAENLKELKMAGELHDIGKISIPDHILGKASKLDKDEWTIMKEHTIQGYNILRAADEYSALANYALTHHERFDGSGYPKNLKGDDIPLFSRIIAIADAFEAMTADRPYRKALTYDMAMKELNDYAGTQFDPKIVKVFETHVFPRLTT